MSAFVCLYTLLSCVVIESECTTVWYFMGRERVYECNLLESMLGSLMRKSGTETTESDAVSFL